VKEGLAGYERLVEHSPIFPYRLLLAICYPTLGQIYEDTGRPALAEEAHHKAYTSIEQLARDYPSATFLKSFVTDRRVLSMVYQARRRVYIPKLIADADDLARQPNLSALSCYNLACFYALASAAGQANSSTTESCALNAIKLLGRAEKGEFFSRGVASQLVTRDTDLDSLRQRDDFKAMLKRLKDTAGKPNSESNSR
jgi:hypothetical protein